MASPQMERAAPPIDALWWAKRTMGYGGESLHRGQVFKLKQLPNDRLLVDLGYVALVPQGASTFPCRECGKEFIDMGLRDGHGKASHERREYVPPAPPTRHPDESKDAYQNRLDEWAKAAGAAADAQDERSVKREEVEAPLDMTKTTASRS